MQIGVRAHLNGIAWSSEFRTVVQRLVTLQHFSTTHYSARQSTLHTALHWRLLLHTAQLPHGNTAEGSLYKNTPTILLQYSYNTPIQQKAVFIQHSCVLPPQNCATNPVACLLLILIAITIKTAKQCWANCTAARSCNMNWKELALQLCVGGGW